MQLWRGANFRSEAVGRSGFAAFNDSAASLGGPEDPNQDFPAGHYLPFPMAVADYVVSDAEVVRIEVR